MAVVFVVQRQKFRNDVGVFVDRFDLESAKDYGEIQFLLGPQARPGNRGIVPTLHEKLRWYTSEDYLLLLGNPCLIGLTVAVASKYSQRLNFLQYNRIDQIYAKVSAYVSQGLPAR